MGDMGVTVLGVRPAGARVVAAEDARLVGPQRAVPGVHLAPHTPAGGVEVGVEVGVGVRIRLR